MLSSFRFFLTVSLITFFAIEGTAQITSDFSASADGWTAPSASGGTLTYSATGGNPGGNISGNDPVSAGPPLYWYFVAPAKFLGNVSSLYNNNITFDLKQAITQAPAQQADVILSNGTITLYYFNISPSPATTTAWSSYSVIVNDVSGNWKTSNSSTGTVATQSQIKNVLINLTLFEIRGRYGSGTLTTGSLDNVKMNVLPTPTPPTITSFTPTSGLPGTGINIIGNNFNTTAAQNVVYFNGVKGTVVNASATQLTVTSPSKISYGPITVINLANGTQTTSPKKFNPLFDNNKDFGGRIIPASMAPGYAALLQNGETAASSNLFGGIAKGDLDNDGWADLVATETGTQKIVVYRNLGTGGTMSAASFSPAFTLPSLTGIPGGGLSSVQNVLVLDADADGKLDVAITCSNGSYGYYAVYRNVSTPGNLSFTAPLFFNYPYYASLLMTSGDLDSDGRIDLLAVTGTSPSNVYICQNLSTPGNIDFAYGTIFNFVGIGAYSDIAVSDLNADGKPEIVAARGSTVHIFPNASTPGTILMNAPITYSPATGMNKVILDDLDADGLTDIIWGGATTLSIYISKNVFDGITFDATSFSPQIPISGPNGTLSGLGICDINADGKVDIVATTTSDIEIFENIAPAGTLNTNSFLSPVLFQGCIGGPGQAISLVGPVLIDLDGDNKPEIAAVYTNNNVTAPVKGVYVFHNESFPVPLITSLTPTSGNAGTSVSLNGNLMNTGNAIPTIRLGSIRANTTSAINTISSTTVPDGSISSRFTITEHGLTGRSNPFQVLFSTNRTINTSSFGTSVDFPLAINTRDALTLADFDEDGKVDVAVADNSSTTKIFQNTQSPIGQAISISSLTESATTYSSSYNMIALDIDGDGKTDLNNGSGLLQSNSAPGSISFLGGPNGVYTNASGFTSAVVTDFNKDGKMDLAVTNGSANIQVFENQSIRGAFSYNGVFSTFATSPVNLAKPNSSGGLAVADFDGDGFDDLLSTNQFADNISYFLNEGQLQKLTVTSFSFLGNYSTSGTGSQPISLTANDFDGDGKIDMAVTYNNAAFVSVYRNTSGLGDISFDPPVDLPAASKGYNIASQDLDGDGLPEIVVIHRPNPGPGSFSVFQNKSTSGTLTFNTAVNYSLVTPARNPQALAIGDINLDQKPDILIVGSPVSTGGNALMVFENKIATVSIDVTQQPSDAFACEGNIATFNATASGTTNISYQWQYSPDGIISFSDLTNGGGYTNVTTSSLSVNTTGNFGLGRYRCRINGDLAATVFTTDKGLNINPIPTPPTTTDVFMCGSTSFTISAAGGTNGQYRWYTVPTGGTALAGEVNNTYTTPILHTTTPYFVSIDNGCESSRTLLIATINPVPTKPTITSSITATGGSVSVCSNNVLTFSAPDGFPDYKWSTGEITPLITVSASGIYTVIVTNSAGCESIPSDAITVTVLPAPCDNQAPVIATTPITTQIEGRVSIDLATLLSDPDNNLDIQSLKIINQPSSGAKASIANEVLLVDYTNTPFSGTDNLTIEVCDLLGACAQQELTIEVIGDLLVYNGISPNGDGQNDFWFIKYIDDISETKNNKVSIYNRWGDLVFEMENYDNKDRVFKGLNKNENELPTGVYFYKIKFNSNRKELTGYLTLKR